MKTGRSSDSPVRRKSKPADRRGEQPEGDREVDQRDDRTSPTRTMGRRKETLPIRLLFVRRLCEASSGAQEQEPGSVPAKTIPDRARPLARQPCRFTKMTVNTIVVRKGRIARQAAPITVCL